MWSPEDPTWHQTYSCSQQLPNTRSECHQMIRDAWPIMERWGWNNKQEERKMAEKWSWKSPRKGRESPFLLIWDSQGGTCQHVQSNNAALQELPLWERPYSTSRVIKMQIFFPESDSKSLNNNGHIFSVGMFDYYNEDVIIMPCKIGHQRPTLE